MDRLSELPDDLIRRVFKFAPTKEAASTCALSPRFRSVWRSSDAVNLVACALEVDTDYYYSNYRQRRDSQIRFESHRDAFVSAAKSALYSTDNPVTRLSLRLEAGTDGKIRDFLYRGDVFRSDNNHVVADVLSHPRARLVEELQIDVVVTTTASFDLSLESSSSTGVFQLSIESLPSETLRVLDLTYCRMSTMTAADVAFPRLTSLRLNNCYLPLEHLQSIIFTAPTLHTVHLASVSLCTSSHHGEKQGTVARLHCPATTWLVLDKCGWPGAAHEVEIDAPRLRRFRYKGLLRHVSLSPQPLPDLTRADLHFFSAYAYGDDDPCRDRLLFWQFIRNFPSAKELKLVVKHIEHIAVVGAAERAKLLRPFPNLERLEVGGMHRPKGKTAAVAIANLLSCCPVLGDLQINLSTTKTDSHKQPRYVREFLQRKSQDDLNNSIQHFLRRRLLEQRGRVLPLQGDEGGDDDTAAYDDEVAADIPAALSGRPFQCLQNSLRHVSLGFRPEKTNCFGMKLIKFFAENAVALEEMRIDDGNNRMSEHINRKVERWIAKSSQERNTSDTVLPLKR